MTALEALRTLGTGAEAPAESKQRVQSALLLSLAAAASAALPAATPSVPAPPVPLIAGLASSKAAAIAVGIWLLGGATGAALYGALHPQQVRVVYVDRPIISASSAAPSQAFVDNDAARNSAPNVVPMRARSAPLASQAAPASDLARERALLDQARANAARGEPGLVLEEVDQHRHQFPHGRLAEEREALAIRALLVLGRSDEARARADAFRSTYPHSFLLPVIDSALSAP